MSGWTGSEQLSTDTPQAGYRVYCQQQAQVAGGVRDSIMIEVYCQGLR